MSPACIGALSNRLRKTLSPAATMARKRGAPKGLAVSGGIEHAIIPQVRCWKVGLLPRKPVENRNQYNYRPPWLDERDLGIGFSEGTAVQPPATRSHFFFGFAPLLPRLPLP